LPVVDGVQEHAAKRASIGGKQLNLELQTFSWHHQGRWIGDLAGQFQGDACYRSDVDFGAGFAVCVVALLRLHANGRVSWGETMHNVLSFVAPKP
jgi:hypothetical protein